MGHPDLLLVGRGCHFSLNYQIVARAGLSPGFPVEFGGFGELHAPFFTERRTRGLVQCCVAGNPGPPDFLWNLVALVNFMRLSLRKGAHAASSSAARQEIRVREMAKKYALTH